MEVCCKQTECLHLLSKIPGNTFTSVGSSVWHLTPEHIISSTYSAIAHAMPQPSYVEVPRPSSSMITSELLVAVCKDNTKGLLDTTAFT